MIPRIAAGLGTGMILQPAASEPVSGNRPDFRRQNPIFWAPDVLLDQRGEAVVQGGRKEPELCLGIVLVTDLIVDCGQFSCQLYGNKPDPIEYGMRHWRCGQIGCVAGLRKI